MTTTAELSKVVRVGIGDSGSIFAKIQYRDGRLSISGVEGPLKNGDAKGSAGQIIGTYKEYDARGYKALDSITPAPGWTPELIRQFFDAWSRWHLNDMKAGCEHQHAENWGDEDAEVVTYKLTHEAMQLRKAAQAEAEAAAVQGRTAQLTATGKALLACEWFKDIHSPPDADSPLSGCYEVAKRETKRTNWVRPDEHARGVLGKPCPVCGYKYGSAWLREEVPAEVLDFFAALPDADRTPAWV